jgi:hypothetical protein
MAIGRRALGHPIRRRTARLARQPDVHQARHRIRLQIPGGAHPRFARSLGTGEDPDPGTAMKPATHHSSSCGAAVEHLPADTGHALTRGAPLRETDSTRQ